jgi:hypothetical protein
MGGLESVGADHNFQLAENTATFFFVCADHRQNTDALAVQAEALRERGRHKEVEAGGYKLPMTAPSSAMPWPKPW